MKSTGMFLKKTMVAVLAAVLLPHISVNAAPLDDLNSILEKQGENSSSLLSETLGWNDLIETKKEQGGEFSLNLELSALAGAFLGLPDQLNGDLGLQLDTVVDNQTKQWQLKGALTQDGESIGDLTLYADEEMLALEIPQLLSYPMGLHSGSLQEQFADTVWEELLEELELTEDIILDFFPDEDSASGSLDLIQKWNSVLEESTDSVEEAMEVTVREDADQPGVTLYDVTYDTESVLDIYGNLLTATLETMQSIPGAETTDIEEFKEEWDEVIEEGTKTLGDTFTVTFSVENEQLSGLSMNLPLTEEMMDVDQDGDGEYTSDQIGTAEIGLVYTDPSQPRVGGELQILLSEEDGEEETVDIRLALTRELTETSEESTLTLTVKEGDEVQYDGDIYYDSYDAQTGDWSCQFQYEEAESETAGLLLNGSFTNVETGKKFEFTLDQAAIFYGSLQLSVASGSLSMSAEPEKIEALENVTLLSDMDETDLMLMAFEISENAQDWMSDMGFDNGQADESEENIKENSDSDDV